MKKCVFFLLAVFYLLLLASCSKEDSLSKIYKNSDITDVKYKNIEIGVTGLDIKTKIHFITNRTDMASVVYPGKTWESYIKEFHNIYPNIDIEVESVTEYEEIAKKRLEKKNWGDIMMIPNLSRRKLSSYFLSYGFVSDLEKHLRFVDSDTSWDGQVFGIPSAITAQGILYNKRIFREAGITQWPKTPDEFLLALKKIKKQTSAIPLYTNYCSGWLIKVWDMYVGICATGDADFLNNGMIHKKNPFSDPRDGTGPYNVYRILYEAVARGYTENNYMITDWESSKGMLNRGEIATMLVGSWAYNQVKLAGPNPEDVGYMPFPILVRGKQYSELRPDYSFGINVKSSVKNKLASMIFVKWLVENSRYQYNEGCIPVLMYDIKFRDFYRSFENIVLLNTAPPLPREEQLVAAVNRDSGLNFNSDGAEKVRAIVEHAFLKDMPFDEIMADWNKRWSLAQQNNGVLVEY